MSERTPGRLNLEVPCGAHRSHVLSLPLNVRAQSNSLTGVETSDREMMIGATAHQLDSSNKMTSEWDKIPTGIKQAKLHVLSLMFVVTWSHGSCKVDVERAGRQA